VPRPSSPAAPADRPVLRRSDVVVAAVVLLVGVAGLLALPAVAAMEPAEPLDAPAAGAARWWLVVLALAAQAVAVAWARAAPRAALVAVAAVAALASAADPGDASGLLPLAVAVVVYRAGVAAPLARTRGALVVVLGLLAVFAATGGAAAEVAEAAPGPLVALVVLGQAVGVVALGLVPALVVGSRRAVRAAQAGELRALAGEQEARVQAALATQRTAMARELHDIAAHHLSGIALMASAVDRQITTDPEAARRGVREVREQSRVVLTDLRRLVGLLRDDAGEETSSLTLASVPDLVAAAPGAGDGVTLEVLRGPDPGAPLGAGVGPLGQLAGYRMVQEALANARSHAAGAACRVTLDDRGADAVVLTVRNDAPAGVPGPAAGDRTGPGGYGLRGMAERAALVGADLRHGPTPDGGWEVRLTLPRDTTTPTEGGPA